jgi:hypothetical protein
MDDDYEDVYTSDVEVTHKRLRFTYCSGGFYRDDASFKADLSEWLPVVMKNGRINKSKSIGKYPQPPKWWRAQCVFRGLPSTGTVEELQAQLRNGPNKMIKDLVDLERNARTEWKQKQEIALVRARQQRLYQESKETANALAQLKPIFENKETSAVVFKKHTQGLDNAAKQMGLSFKWIRAPAVTLTLEWWDEWIIIGRTAAAVEAKHASILQQQEDEDMARELQEEEKKKAKRAAEAVAHEAVAEQSSRTAGGWDVTGKWKITCSEDDGDDIEVAKGWGRTLGGSLIIYYVESTKKVAQMFGQFEFAGYEGWLRFEDPASDCPPALTVGVKRKRLAWDCFLLPLSMKPSPQQSTWDYRWRGRPVDGESYLEHGSENEYPGSITFSGKGGCNLSGTFWCPWFNGKITGVKAGVADSGSKVVPIDETWGYLYDSDYCGMPEA